MRLAAYHQENHIYIEVSDDGRGIDAEQVKRSALAKGLITEEEAQQLHGDEALDLLFLPGFSTSGQVTDVRVAASAWTWCGATSSGSTAASRWSPRWGGAPSGPSGCR